MNYTPITFSKNYEVRLQDISDILNPSRKLSCIKGTWSDCVDFMVEPVGWLAIWNISRNLCLDLKIHFPCSAIVNVEQVNAEDLSCLVSVREVEDESVQLPERMADVPLIELYPTEEQDNLSALSISRTAELLDNLRFFYKHIWMPWDLELDDEADWVENHLQPRLQLYFSLVERNWPHIVSYKVRELVTKGRRVAAQIEDLTADMEDDSESDSRLLQLTELHHALSIVKNKCRIYENPRLLKAQLEKEERAQKSQELSSGIAEVNLFCVLWQNLTSDRLAAITSKVQQHLSGEKSGVRMFSSLQEVLVRVPAGADIWLSRGEHPIYDLGVLEAGGTITGVEEGVVIADDTEGSRTLDVERGSLNLSCLTLKLTFNRNIVKVRPGAVCSLRDVRLEGLPVVDGIDVFTSATLSAVNCHFVNFFTAVTCDTQSSLHLTNCTFSDNKVALQLKQGCSLTMENCTIAGSKQFGVLLVVPRPIPENKTSIDLINRLSGMKESGTICRQNGTDLHLICDSWNVQSLDNK